MVVPACIGSIKTVWGHKMCIRTADCSGFFVHKRGKTLYASADGLRDHHRRIVV